MDSWSNLIQTLGVATGCLVFLGFGIYRVLSWLGENVVKPVVTRHLSFLDDMQKAVDAQTAAAASQAQVSREFADCLQKMTKDLIEVRTIVLKDGEAKIVTHSRVPPPGPS